MTADGKGIYLISVARMYFSMYSSTEIGEIHPSAIFHFLGVKTYKEAISSLLIIYYFYLTHLTYTTIYSIIYSIIYYLFYYLSFY